MAYLLDFAQLQAFTLAGSGVAIGDTTINLTSFKDIDGNLLTMTAFGAKGFATLEPNGSLFEEQISFTGITQNANGTAVLTGVKHVLFITPYTESSGLTKAHAGGSKLVISNTSGLYNSIIDYIDGIAIAGSPDATLTTKGIVEMATTAQTDAGTATGETGADLAIRPDQLASSIYATRLPSADQKAALAGTGTPNGTTGKYVTNDDTGETGNSKVVRTKSTGKLDTSIVDLTGYQTTTIFKSGIITRAGSTASGAVNTAHGLGVIPKKIRITCISGSSSTTQGKNYSSHGTYNGTTTSSIYVMTGVGGAVVSANSSSNIVHMNGTIASDNYQSAVATFDDTNIILTWTKHNSPETQESYLLWEAEA